MLTSTSNPTSTAVTGGIIGGMIGFFLIVGLVFYILTVIAIWKIFEKAGEKGWKAIIPFYNVYIMFKIVKMTGWFWGILIGGIIYSIISTINNMPNLYIIDSTDVATYYTYYFTANPIMLFITIVWLIINLTASIIYSWRMSKVFGHGVGYFIGLIFLPNIFWLILGFGKSKYNKKALKS